MEKKRVFLIVLDSYGIGEMTDAADFGDVGANTLKTITKVKEYDTPNMKRIGLFNIDGVDWMEKEAPYRFICTYEGAVQRERYDDRALGDCRSDLSKTASDISGWIPEGSAGCV